jgi:type I restriction enzyme S subunit
MEIDTKDPISKTIADAYKNGEENSIPNDWEIRLLRKLVNFTNGKAHEKSIDESGDYIVVNSKFISTEGEVKKFTNENNCPAKQNNILMVMSDVPNGKAIAKCYLVEEDNLYTVNQRICALQAIDVDSKFLFYALDRNKYYLQFDDGVKQTNLRKDDVLNCPLPLPPTIKEQQAIAEALSDVDALIAELDALIKKKQQVKKGTMQQLLTGEKRLPGFDGEWEEKKLGEVLYVQGGYAFKSANFQKFGIPIIRISNIQDGAIDLEESAFYSPDSHIPNEFKIEKGEALIAMSGATTGKVGLYSHDQVAYQNQRVGKFVVNDSRHTDDSYILHLVSSDHFRKVLSKELEQGAQPNVSAKQLEGLVFNMPNDVEEQKAIAQILGDIDAEIQGLQSKRVKYEQIKQGMMQELLTGKTRLVE